MGFISSGGTREIHGEFYVCQMISYWILSLGKVGCRNLIGCLVFY